MKKINNGNKNIIKIGLFVVLLALLVLFAMIISVSRVDSVDAFSEYEVAVPISDEILSAENIASTQVLYSLDKQPDFLLVNFRQQGYAVFCRLTGEPLQVNKHATSPFENVVGKPIYAGPHNYFVSNILANNRSSRQFQTFYNILTNETIYIENANEVAVNIRENIIVQSGIFGTYQSLVLEQLRLSTVNNSLVEIQPFSDNKYRPDLRPIFPNATYIPNKNFFIARPQHAANDRTVHPQIPAQDACGVVAAQLVISYHNYFTDRRMISEFCRRTGTRFLATDYGNLNYWPAFVTDPFNSRFRCERIGTTDGMFLNLLGQVSAHLQDPLSIQRRMRGFLDEHYLDANRNSLRNANVSFGYTVMNPVGTRNRGRYEINNGSL